MKMPNSIRLPLIATGTVPAIVDAIGGRTEHVPVFER
jgi:hypothetical protein